MGVGWSPLTRVGVVLLAVLELELEDVVVVGVVVVDGAGVVAGVSKS